MGEGSCHLETTDGAFPQGEAIVLLPLHLLYFHQEGRGLEREKPEGNCVRMRTGTHSLRMALWGDLIMDSVLVVCISLVYSAEFGDKNNANKKKNSNDHVLNTYVQGIGPFLFIHIISFKCLWSKCCY